MKVSFEFVNGETRTQIATAILDWLGAGSSAVIGAVAAIPGQTINPADNPEAGGTPTPTVAPNGAIVLDTEGMPHDKRIHSDNATQTDKGAWRKRKGVDATTLAAVTAELRAKYPQTAAPAVAPVVPPAVAPVLTPLPTAGAVPPLPTPAAPQPGPFENIVTFLSQNMNGAHNPNGRLTEQYVSDMLKHYGIASGTVASLQTESAERIAAIRAGFAQALGLPANS